MAPNENLQLRFSGNSHAYYKVDDNGRTIELSVQKPRQMTDEAAKEIRTMVFEPLLTQITSLPPNSDPGSAHFTPEIRVSLPGDYTSFTKSGRCIERVRDDIEVQLNNCPNANGSAESVLDPIRHRLDKWLRVTEALNL